MTKSDLEKAVATAVAAERERCAEICRLFAAKDHRVSETSNTLIERVATARASNTADAIRRAILGEDE